MWRGGRALHCLPPRHRSHRPSSPGPAPRAARQYIRHPAYRARWRRGASGGHDEAAGFDEEGGPLGVQALREEREGNGIGGMNHHKQI